MDSSSLYLSQSLICEVKHSIGRIVRVRQNLRVDQSTSLLAKDVFVGVSIELEIGRFCLVRHFVSDYATSLAVDMRERIVCDVVNHWQRSVITLRSA